ncbi:MAG TPA: alpha/beta hydrolase-fold protein [Ohtaekwangia sp.]
MITFKKPLVLLAMVALLSCGSDDDDGNPGGGGGGGDDTDLNSLPDDTGGTHTPVQKGTTGAEFGYYVYTPGNLDDSKSYPLLIFLHGKSERGNGTTDLNKVLANGPPKIINSNVNTWKAMVPHPMIVASPQYHPADGAGADNNWGEYHTEELKGFIDHMLENYPINPKRIYLTGLSHGGTGLIDYIILGPGAGDHVAAAVPIAAYGYGGSINYPNAKNIPIWMFVGGGDTSGANNLTSCQGFYNKYNAQTPAPAHDARLTIYPGAPHDVWTRTYSLSGMSETTDAAYDDFDMNIYEWMLQYKTN